MDWFLLIQPIVFLGVALFVLVRGADAFVFGAKQVGAHFGMSKFAIGVLIVGFGTSLPELAASIAAVFSNATEIVIANAVGSNITNILLVVGTLALIGGRIGIKRELIKTELPIFFIATTLFLAVVYDGVVDRIEGLLLLSAFACYLWYLFVESKEDSIQLRASGRRPNLDIKAFAFVIVGAIAVIAGAHFAVENVVTIATLFSVPIGLISIAAIAIGTSLPELTVSLQALKSGEAEMAIGNIFGSNAFNILVVIGLPALVAPLVAGEVVMGIGLGVFLAASAIFFVNGLAKQVMRWEGMMMLLFFAFFILKLADFVI